MKLANDVFSQQDMLPDMDFVRVFADGVSMSYEVDADGSRKRTQLSAEQVQLLDQLNACCLDQQWHPCQISCSCAEAIAHDKQLSACAACASQMVQAAYG